MPRVLVADDNSNISKTANLALKDAGIEVVAVANGEAAVRKLPDLLPDLILADIFMPVRSGYEVCDYVKRDPRFSLIPVILLVGAFDPFDEKEARRVRADGVLKKPFVPPDPLINMVKALLAKAANLNPGEDAVPVSTGTGASRLAEEPSRLPGAGVGRREFPHASGGTSQVSAATLTEVNTNAFPLAEDLPPAAALIPSPSPSDSGLFAESPETEADSVSTTARDPILGEPVWNHAAVSGETPLEEITEEHTWGLEPIQDSAHAPPALDLYPGSVDTRILTLAPDQSDHDFGAAQSFELTALETTNAEPPQLQIGVDERSSTVTEDHADSTDFERYKDGAAESLPSIEAPLALESSPGEQASAPAPANPEPQAALLPSLEIAGVAAETRMHSGQPAEEESVWPLLLQGIGAAEALPEPCSEALCPQVGVLPRDNPEHSPHWATESPLAFPVPDESGGVPQIGPGDASNLLADNSRELEPAALEAECAPTCNSTAEPTSLGVPVTEGIADLEREAQPKSTTVTTVAGSKSLPSPEFPSAAYTPLADIAPIPSISEAHDPSDSSEGSLLDCQHPLGQEPALDVHGSFSLVAGNSTQQLSELEPAPPNSLPNTAAEESVTFADPSEVTCNDDPSAGDVPATERLTLASELLGTEAIEAIVTRVVDRLQLSIKEVLTRELLRPIVEALVRSELDSH